MTGDEMITLYVDVLFLINFSVDYIVLALTGAFFHFQIKKYRELLAAFILTVYAMWALLLCGSYVILILSAVLVIFAACFFVYPVRGFIAVTKCVMVFSFLSLLFGGIIELLFRVVGHYANHMSGERDGRQVIVFALLALVSGGLIYIGNRLLEKGKGVHHVHVEMELLNKVYRAELFVDTGNMAREPISGRRVIFLTEQYAKRSGLNQYINNNEGFKTIKRVICMETASGKRAIPVYMCEKIQLKNKTVCGAIAIIKNDSQKGYDGIFPSALL